MEHIKHYFETYKESTEVHETSNGFLFHKLTDAEAHAKTLEDKNVKTYSRSEVEHEVVNLPPVKTEEELAKEKADYDAQIESQKAELQKTADEEAAKAAKEKADADALLAKTAEKGAKTTKTTETN